MKQEDMVLGHLMVYGSINPRESLDRLGVYRLSARISDLRQRGYKIDTEIRKRDGVRWAVYHLKKPLPGEQTEERQESGKVGNNSTSEIITNH